MKRNLVSVFTAMVMATLFCSWHSMKQAPIKQADWFIGTWVSKYKGRSTYETWIKVSEVELKGKSYTIKDKDTAVTETIQLIQKHNTLFYIPTIKNQNNNLPVSFSLKTSSDKQLVFENPKHDFPQIISYRRITEDSLVAEISGLLNGQEHKKEYPMRRIK